MVGLTGLLFGCPFGTEVTGCPMHELRGLPPADRVRALRLLPSLEQHGLAARHAVCRDRREYGKSPQLLARPVFDY